MERRTIAHVYSEGLQQSDLGKLSTRGINARRIEYLDREALRLVKRSGDYYASQLEKVKSEIKRLAKEIRDACD